MRIAGIALVLLVSRIAALAGHQLVWSWWSPVAYLWQDAAVVLTCLAIDRVLRRTPRIAWTAYAIVVAYVAAGVPVTRVMSTPMTWTMWRAAGGALGDSMWHYVTVPNLLWIAAVLVVGISVPCALPDSPPPVLSLSKNERAEPRGSTRSPRALVRSIGTISISIAVVALGPAAISRVDTRGLDRNAWSAIVSSALLHLSADASTEPAAPKGSRDWRRGIAARTPLDDLRQFRGAAVDRNVILVSLESTAAQYLSLYGADKDVMPTLSVLARSAIVFDHAYAVYPESIKGLFSILCSEYPAFNRTADSYTDVPCRSIASRLVENGYRTALFHSGRFGYLGMESVVRNRGFQVLADAGDIGGRHESSFGVDDRTTVARILRWIDDTPRGERFFVTYLPISGHHPYEAPEVGPFRARDEFGRYQNALHYSDAVLADLVRGIDARGLREHTVWIVLGDHGEAFGQHDGNVGHTFQLYEENVHVPFLIAAPGVIVRHIRARQVVSLIDTAPTIFDLLGLPEDAAYQGRSALEAEPRMALFFADYSLGLLGLRDGGLKHIYDLDSNRSRLFDLAHDPQEAHDIAADRVDDVRWYAQRLRAWIAAQKAQPEISEF